MMIRNRAQCKIMVVLCFPVRSAKVDWTPYPHPPLSVAMGWYSMEIYWRWKRIPSKSAVKPLCQIFFFVGIKQGCLKSKDTFLRVVPSRRTPCVAIRLENGWWEHRPKDNYLIISHKTKNSVAIGREKGWWEHYPKDNYLIISRKAKDIVAIGQ